MTEREQVASRYEFPNPIVANDGEFYIVYHQNRWEIIFPWFKDDFSDCLYDITYFGDKKIFVDDNEIKIEELLNYYSYREAIIIVETSSIEIEITLGNHFENDLDLSLKFFREMRPEKSLVVDYLKID